MSLTTYVEKRIADTYRPGVYMLTGVNGIGKSSVVEAITQHTPNTVPLHASQELRGLFGNISRDELELLTPEDKLSRMVLHFTAIFERETNNNRAVIMDTHLLVPIRSGADVQYENIWSTEYRPYVSSMVMLSARPESIRRWRQEDELSTGRKRNTDLSIITSDQQANIEKFVALRSIGELPDASQIVVNNDSHISNTRAAVDAVYRSIEH